MKNSLNEKLFYTNRVDRCINSKKHHNNIQKSHGTATGAKFNNKKTCKNELEPTAIHGKEKEDGEAIKTVKY